MNLLLPAIVCEHAKFVVSLAPLKLSHPALLQTMQDIDFLEQLCDIE